MKLLTTAKRNFKRGASLVIALVIFMLCALAGSSAFFMATSNAGRFAHANDQEYYSVSSAALTVVDVLDGLEYESQNVLLRYERTWQFESGTSDPSTGKQHDIKDGYTLEIPTAPGTISGAEASAGGGFGLRDAIGAHCDLLVPFVNIPDDWYSRVQNVADAPTRPGSIEPLTYSFTVDVKDGAGNADARYETVHCKLLMDANYNLILTFGGANGEYSMSVYWVADVKPVSEIGDRTYDYFKPDASGNYSGGSMRQDNSLRVTARWTKENVTISRGEAITNE